MPFWQKSEDPWDQTPERREPRSAPAPSEAEDADAPESEGLLDRLKSWKTQREAAEREKLTLPPEKCPWCGGDMEQGYIHGEYWARGTLTLKRQLLNAAPPQESIDLRPFPTAWYCAVCRKLTVDMAGLTFPDQADPNEFQRYVEQWKEIEAEEKQRRET